MKKNFGYGRLFSFLPKKKKGRIGAGFPTEGKNKQTKKNNYKPNQRKQKTVSLHKVVLNLNFKSFVSQLVDCVWSCNDFTEQISCM